MNYLQVNFEAKESVVAGILNDGRLAHAYTEERYTRKKYDDNFPYNSLKYLSHNFYKDVAFYNTTNIEDDYINIIKALYPNITIYQSPSATHHVYHCYESFYTSGFESAAVLVVDGMGSKSGNDYESITLFHKVGKDTKILKQYYGDESLGRFYQDACNALGFTENEEGHFMGLSSYGRPFDNRYAKFENGKILIKYKDACKKYAVDNKKLDCLNSVNFAATVQRDTVECVLGLVKYIKELTGEDNLCLSGGVFNNVLVNNTICESGIFKNVWCSPAPGDYGIAVGIGYYNFENATKGKIFNKRMESPYLGKEYNDEGIITYLNSIGIKYNEISLDEIADLLVDDKIVVWFQGRSEYGRRALGHRSILSNPFYVYNYKKVSQMIKHRAPYRPLACTVPDELFDIMFDVKNKDLTEYMLRAIEVKKAIREKIEACLAIDNTTRPQNLHRDINPEFYDMIMLFYKKTGIPAVINTSLNAGGEPIVESLYDLFKFCEKQFEVNYVVLNGKYVINNDELRSFMYSHVIPKTNTLL